MRRNYKVWTALIFMLMLLSSACTVFVLGQGGTGRETPKANSSKSPPATKRKRPTRKAANKTPSTAPANSNAPANNRSPQVIDAPKADDAAAIERTYWETIKLSTKAEDFRSYLEKYPNGLFAGPARDNLTRLETPAKTPLKRDSAGRIILGSISGSSEKAAKPPPKAGSVIRNQIGMELVYVPAGSFRMGSNNGRANETPVHEVTIKEGFYMGRYEVTQAEWQQVMGNNSSHNKGDRLPVDHVSWDEAQSFIDKLNERGYGFKYRLPTEAEWEYACRAGTTGDYASELNEMAWHADNSGNGTHPVGTKQANAFGLYDMHGNVWEWCADYHHETYDGAPTDGSAWVTGGPMKYRVLRGGSWGSNASDLRSADRGRFAPGQLLQRLRGFRVVAVSTVK